MMLGMMPPYVATDVAGGKPRASERGPDSGARSIMESDIGEAVCLRRIVDTYRERRPWTDALDSEIPSAFRRCDECRASPRSILTEAGLFDDSLFRWQIGSTRGPARLESILSTSCAGPNGGSATNSASRPSAMTSTVQSPRLSVVAKRPSVRPAGRAETEDRWLCPVAEGVARVNESIAMRDDEVVVERAVVG